MSKIAKLIIAAAAIGATTFATAPASAESGPAPLPDSAGAFLSKFHLYQHSDFSGCHTTSDLQSGSLASQEWGYFGCLTTINNKASSMRNDYAQSIFLYDSEDCSGTMYIAAPNSEDKTFSNNNINDKASCIDY